MPDDQNTTQNPISTENSLPSSSQEPTEQSTENTAHSEPSGALPEAVESSPSEFSVKSNDIPPTDSTHIEPKKEPGTEEKQAFSDAEALMDRENEPVAEPQPEADQPLDETRDKPPAEIQPPETASEPETAQILENEPLSKIEEPESESPKEEIKEESKQETSKIEPEAEPEIPETKSETKTPEPALESPKEEKTKEEIKKEPEPEKEEKPKLSYLKSQKLGELLMMARTAIQFRKKKKLEKIMTLFLKKQKITNDEVEKFLHVSDATATRYLSGLEKQGKVKQIGKTGKGVSYSRI
ncbi:MAG: hypothetical protein WC646_00015 [Candidatus Paceibacterota bacterium]|jgi:hypothetical protein